MSPTAVSRKSRFGKPTAYVRRKYIHQREYASNRRLFHNCTRKHTRVMYSPHEKDGSSFVVKTWKHPHTQAPPPPPTQRRKSTKSTKIRLDTSSRSFFITQSQAFLWKWSRNKRERGTESVFGLMRPSTENLLRVIRNSFLRKSPSK